MKNLILILVLMAALSGCTTEKRCHRRYPPQLTGIDSVYVKTTETIRDTIIKIAPDSSAIELLVLCDSISQAYLSRIISFESGRNAIIPEVTLLGRILTVKCKVDSMAVYSKIKERVKENFRVKVEKEIIRVNELTRFQQRMTELGWLFIVVVVLAIAMAVKRFLNFIK